MASVTDICMPCPANVYILTPAVTPGTQPSPPTSVADVLNGHGPPNKTVNVPSGTAAFYYDLDDGSVYKWDPAAQDWTA